MMRLALVVLLVGSTMAQSFNRPQVRQAPHIEIVRSESTGPEEDGSYYFSYEGSDGTRREQSGRPTGPNLHQVQGTYSYTDPEGNRVEVSFVADENGYVAQSPFLPVAPPLPVHALEQIRFAEEQKRQGVVYDEQGFVAGRRGGF
ncbi:cuticle protein AM1274-like [Oratosquilla oratoria]|uniref:cuticle protein AM1274-like n=1 Tax=Oratosquilla oratoria TaxID=337810 RepID=UPI003F76D712